MSIVTKVNSETGWMERWWQRNDGQETKLKNDTNFDAKWNTQPQVDERKFSWGEKRLANSTAAARKKPKVIRQPWDKDKDKVTSHDDLGKTVKQYPKDPKDPKGNILDLAFEDAKKSALVWEENKAAIANLEKKFENLKNQCCSNSGGGKKRTKRKYKKKRRYKKRRYKKRTKKKKRKYKKKRTKKKSLRK